MERSRMWKVGLGVASMVLLTGWPLAAEEGGAETEPRWADTAELALLATGGNSEAESIAMRNTLTRNLDKATFTLDAGAFRAKNTAISRFAVGTPGEFSPQEVSRSQITAENYFLRGRFDRRLRENLFWFAGLGWDRNEFAGIKNRSTAVGGVGNIWFDDQRGHLRTDYGLTFTDQEDVVGVGDSFAGVRLSLDYGRPFSATAGYAAVLIVDQNIDETSDLRADFTNSVTASLSDRLALKVSLQALFDNLPALSAVPLVTAAGQPTGDLVLVPLDDLDTLFSASLVVNF